VLQKTLTESFYGFCPSGRKVDDELWAKEHPLFIKKQSCVALHFEENEPSLSGLTQANCALRMPIICHFSTN